MYNIYIMTLSSRLINILNNNAIKYYMAHKNNNKENQVLVMSVPKELSYEIKRVYETRNPKAIKDLEIIHEDDYSDIYCGGSYGASSLFGAVGELLYYKNK